MWMAPTQVLGKGPCSFAISQTHAEAGQGEAALQGWTPLRVAKPASKVKWRTKNVKDTGQLSCH
jgi:hypothetical protein